jgi:FMN-dependent NADH-azoreductase
MPDVLYVQSSPRRDESESQAIAEAFLAAYRGAVPAATIDVLDLWEEPLPAFAGAHVAAKMAVIGGHALEGDKAEAWDQILAVTSRFAAADSYLFTVPMWNHNVPWVLKHLIDTVTQPGVTFGFDAERGYVGLLQGKRALVVHSSAVWPSFGDHVPADYVEDWLRFVGVEEVHSIRLGSNLLALDVEHQRARARARAAELGSLFARHAPRRA